MRFFEAMPGWLAGTGLCVTGTVLLVGCGKDFDGCQASRTCGAAEASAGEGGSPGKGGDPAGKGGKAGRASDGMGGSGANGGSSGANGGSSKANGGESGSPGEGGETSTDEAHDAGSGGQPDLVGPAQGGAGGETRNGGAPSADDDGGASGTAGEMPTEPGDHEAPHILSSLPASGATGVHADVDITVTFSEPMDKASTVAAYQSTDLPPDKVTLSWLTDTVLLIHPKLPLVYAEVKDPAADAKHYSFSLAGAAADLAGNPLGDERTFVFTTLRHITSRLPIQSARGRQVTHPGGVSPSDSSQDKSTKACDDVGSSMAAGDDSGNDALAFIAEFDLSSVPAAVDTWNSATLSASLSHSSSSPFGEDRLGELLFYSIAIGDLKQATWSMPTLADLGVFSHAASDDTPQKDVLAAVQKDYANRIAQASASQFLFRFTTGSNDNDAGQQAYVSCNQMHLALDYVAP